MAHISWYLYNHYQLWKPKAKLPLAKKQLYPYTDFAGGVFELPWDRSSYGTKETN